MKTNQLNIEANYLKKSSYLGKVSKNETTLENIQDYEVGDKFVMFSYYEDIDNCDEDDLLALMVPVEDIIDIKIYKR